MKYKSIKVMLLPNNWQRTRLFQYSGVARFSYNWALQREMESLASGKGFISDSDLRKEFTILRNSEDYKWLQSVSNDVPKQAIKDLVSSYIKYFKYKKKTGYRPYSKKQLEHAERVGKPLTEYDKQHHPKFKSKKNFNDYSFFNDSYKLVVTDTHIRLSALQKIGSRCRQDIKNSIKLAEVGRIPVNCKLFNPRISFDGLNWWISVSYEIDDLIITPTSTGIGIDIGVKETAILSDGSKFENINKSRTVQRLEKRKKRLQKRISRKYLINKKGESYQKTKNIRKSELRLLKLNRRLTNIRHNHIHQMTSSIVKREPSFIVIEDLNVSGMMKNKHLSKAVQQQCFYEIRRQLTYKTADSGIQLVLADRFFPSSKMCNNCGKIKKDLKLSDRVYVCDCGYVEDRDVNAAKNLYTYGLNYV